MSMEIDGVELRAGDRILVTGQHRWWKRLWNRFRRQDLNPQEGIYVVLPGEWTRHGNDR